MSSFDISFLNNEEKASYNIMKQLLTDNSLKLNDFEKHKIYSLLRKAIGYEENNEITNIELRNKYNNLFNEEEKCKFIVNLNFPVLLFEFKLETKSEEEFNKIKTYIFKSLEEVSINSNFNNKTITSDFLNAFSIISYNRLLTFFSNTINLQTFISNTNKSIETLQRQVKQLEEDSKSKPKILEV